MLCKVQATTTFEHWFIYKHTHTHTHTHTYTQINTIIHTHSARDAAHLWGGESYVKGNRIESLCVPSHTTRHNTATTVQRHHHSDKIIEDEDSITQHLGQHHATPPPSGIAMCSASPFLAAPRTS
jgi:hypothetical protein